MLSVTSWWNKSSTKWSQRGLVILTSPVMGMVMQFSRAEYSKGARRSSRLESQIGRCPHIFDGQVNGRQQGNKHLRCCPHIKASCQKRHQSVSCQYIFKPSFARPERTKWAMPSGQRVSFLSSKSYGGDNLISVRSRGLGRHLRTSLTRACRTISSDFI